MPSGIACRSSWCSRSKRRTRRSRGLALTPMVLGSSPGSVRDVVIFDRVMGEDTRDSFEPSVDSPDLTVVLGFDCAVLRRAARAPGQGMPRSSA